MKILYIVYLYKTSHTNKLYKKVFQKEGNIARHIFKSPASKQSAPLFGSLLETVQSTSNLQ